MKNAIKQTAIGVAMGAIISAALFGPMIWGI